MKNKLRRYRLSDYQAANLGLELKKINRYSLTVEQEEKHLSNNLNLESTTRKGILIDAFNNQDNLKPLPKNIKISKTGKRVLVIGDLHEPFCLDGYLDHCLVTYKNYECDTVVFIGDIIDSHFSSFHEICTDALGADDELNSSIIKLNKWYRAFPEATVIIGNHDRLVMRKANTGGISSKWIRPYNEVLEVTNWIFTERRVIDDVQYIHGESGRASKKAKDDMISTVQGHRHSEMFVEWIVGYKQKIFGCAVGCGVDINSYAMRYGKAFKKPAIGCAVIEDGLLATNVPMEL